MSRTDGAPTNDLKRKSIQRSLNKKLRKTNTVNVQNGSAKKIISTTTKRRKMM